jgi:alpha-tubulin suppressor-like RCC1 family protein
LFVEFGAMLALVSCGSSAGSSSTHAAIVAVQAHTCMLDSGGKVTCWGYNEYGQLGDGTTTDRLRPVAVSGLSSGVSAIAAGGVHTCALVDKGAVECWGNNFYGQLGDGKTGQSQPSPVAVSGLPGGVRAIAAGGSGNFFGDTCALLDTGAVECWGQNIHGELGDGTTTERHAPVPVSGLSSGVSAIAVGVGDGFPFTCALLDSGRVRCWGDNLFGELGDGTTTERHTPVAVAGLPTDVKGLAAGGDHACALLSSGGVKCWGANAYGQLGDGTTTIRHTPVTVSGLSDVQAISAGGSHTCALLSSGGVVCWGTNGFGELGDGTTTDRHTPVAVSGLSSGVDAIAAGSDYTCALLAAGGFKCWGSNTYGQLGNGSRTDHLDLGLRGRGAVTAADFRCPSSCSIERAPGTRIALTEHPAKGWRFKRWEGACRGHARRCTLVLKRRFTWVTARFSKRR